MITINHPICFTARLTFECQSPLSTKGEDSDPTVDNSIFRDAQGYPLIPGTSIAGVLNHLAQDTKISKDLFGKADNCADATTNDNQASRFRCSFGFVHSENNQPAKGSLQTAISTQTDSAVSRLLHHDQPILRDQVRITENGTAQDQGKFDVTALPKGTRFTVEIGLAANELNEDCKKEWQQLLELFNHPSFRIGGQTHRGMGQVKQIAIQQKEFDFRQAKTLTEWQKWQEQPWIKSAKSPTINQAENAITTLTLNLQAEDFWRIGGGNKTLQSQGKDPHEKPYTETIIQWQGNKASLKDKQIVIPSTSIKGALRHRTLFHLRKLEQDWEGKQFTNESLAPLFGLEANHEDKTGNTGALIINDIYLENINPRTQTKVMMHNAIDRFTGGTINGALYSEELLYQNEFECQIHIKETRLKKNSSNLLTAFKLAIEDLGQGRLPLGSASSKGHGYFAIINLQKIQQQLDKLLEAPHGRKV